MDCFSKGSCLPFPHVIFEIYIYLPDADSTSGDSWKSSSGWLSGASDCEWEFVTCHESGTQSGLVSALRLSKNNLIGKF
jgi:hypothetical protein